jgi:hypothetical protein
LQTVPKIGKKSQNKSRNIVAHAEKDEFFGEFHEEHISKTAATSQGKRTIDVNHDDKMKYFFITPTYQSVPKSSDLFPAQNHQYLQQQQQQQQHKQYQQQAQRRDAKNIDIEDETLTMFFSNRVQVSKTK